MRAPVFTATLLSSLCFAAAPVGFETERPLAFTVTGPTVHAGEHEIVLSSTPRFGRATEFVRLENLLGFSYGLRRNIDFQLLLSIAIESFGVDNRAAEGGVATRWRWQLLDPMADPLGVSVIATAGVGLVSVFAEARVSAEKWLGDFLFALNVSADYQAHNDGRLAPDLHLEQSGGLAYRLANRFTSGFELRNRVVLQRGEYFGDAYYAGPVFAFRAKSWWLSFAFLAQVGAVKASALNGNGEPLELRDSERFVLRLQAAFEAP